MAQLVKRGDKYHLRFKRTRNGKATEKSFSLNVNTKKSAERLKIEYEDKYERGEIDPFNGWTPQSEIEAKREAKLGSYMPLSDACHLFLKERTHIRKNTVKNYKRHFDMFENLVGKSMPVNQISEQDIRDFCFKESVKPATQASYLRHMKVLFRWLFDKKYINRDLVKDIKAPRIPNSLSQKIIDEEQFQLLLDTHAERIKKLTKAGHTTTKDQQQLWFKPLMTLLFFTGLRISEALRLEWSDINFSSGFLMVTNKAVAYTKSGEERAVPIRRELLPVLKKWHTDHKKPNKGLVFPSVKSYVSDVQMTGNRVSKTFRTIVAEAGLPNTINLHSLRHSCVTSLLKKNVPLHEVSKFVGHSDIKVTLGYEHLSSEDL
ncbi:MAG: tyrosine-type recombinase/integrase, partial [Balneolales bacterium]